MMDNVEGVKGTKINEGKQYCNNIGPDTATIKTM
jgi:hypothetical protein